MVYRKEAIKVQYLVCLTRAKKYCACGDEVRCRDFRDGDIGERRKLLACRNSQKNADGQWIGGCGFSSAWPRCYCPRRNGGVDFYQAACETSRNLFVCKKNMCRFQQQIERRSYEHIPSADDYVPGDEIVKSFVAPG